MYAAASLVLVLALAGALVTSAAYCSMDALTGSQTPCGFWVNVVANFAGNAVAYGGFALGLAWLIRKEASR